MRFYDPTNKDSPERLDSKELFPRCDEDEGAKRCVKLGFLPSVTTVLNVHREEYLERWLMGQAIQEFDLNGGDAKSAVDYIYNRESENAQFGTDCHSVMEAVMQGLPIPDVSELVIKHSAPLINWITDNVVETIFCERTMASSDVGAAGTVDMVFVHKTGRRIIGDLKVAKFSWKFPPKPGLSYKMQLSAYEGMIQEIRPDEYTRMSIYLASPFGWDKKPDIQVFEHGKCYITAFKAAKVLWEEGLSQERPQPMKNGQLHATFDPKQYRKP